MVELLLTCFLAAGWTYTPPDGWTIKEVGIMGMRNICDGGHCLSIMVYPIENSYVRIHRFIKIGERVEAPQGCSIQIEANKEGG